MRGKGVAWGPPEYLVGLLRNLGWELIRISQGSLKTLGISRVDISPFHHIAHPSTPLEPSSTGSPLQPMAPSFPLPCRAEAEWSETSHSDILPKQKDEAPLLTPGEMSWGLHLDRGLLGGLGGQGHELTCTQESFQPARSHPQQL